jgi:DNA-binding NtrC family response regulator
VSEHQRKVLILDRDPDLLILLQHMLEGAGIDTTITWNRIEARELAKKIRFDVILVDYSPDLKVETIRRDFKINESSSSCLLLGATQREAERFCRHGISGVIPQRDPLRVLEEVERCWHTRTVEDTPLNQAF